MLAVCAWCPLTSEETLAIERGEPVTHGICDQHYLELLEESHGCDAVSGDPTRAGRALAPLPFKGSEGNSGEVFGGRGAETPSNNTGGRSQSIT